MTRWLVCRQRRPTAVGRLYCFPHAGGSPGEYVRWSDRLPEVEVWGVQPPGRGSRLAEPAFTRIGDLAVALVEQVQFVAPFGFFGHSLGALVAYETALALRAAGRPTPDCLVVSGSAAPQHKRNVETLPGDGELARRAGLPAAVREDPELMRPALAMLRADLTAFATYRAAPVEPLHCTLTAVAGDQDEISETELLAWQDCTTGPFRFHLLPGGHFYLREEHDALLELIAHAFGIS